MPVSPMNFHTETDVRYRKVRESPSTDLIDERSHVFARDDFRKQDEVGESKLTPWDRYLGLSLEKCGLFIRTSDSVMMARHGRMLRAGALQERLPIRIHDH